MQDIDFGKYLPHARPRTSSTSKSCGTSHGKRLFILVITFIVAFTLGIFGGMYITLSKIPETDFLLNEPKDDSNEPNASKKQPTPREQTNDRLISKNIPPTSEDYHLSASKNRSHSSVLKDKFSQINGQKTYLIWAKTYQNNVTAYRHGHFLKKQNLPVFLAKNGTRMKLYIGPIHGKKKAYQMLSKVKKWAPFKASVLHEKTD